MKIKLNTPCTEERKKAYERLTEVRRVRHKLETEWTKGKTLGDVLTDDELNDLTEMIMEVASSVLV